MIGGFKFDGDGSCFNLDKSVGSTFRLHSFRITLHKSKVLKKILKFFDQLQIWCIRFLHGVLRCVLLIEIIDPSFTKSLRDERRFYLTIENPIPRDALEPWVSFDL